MILIRLMLNLPSYNEISVVEVLIEKLTTHISCYSWM